MTVNTTDRTDVRVDWGQKKAAPAGNRGLTKTSVSREYVLAGTTVATQAATSVYLYFDAQDILIYVGITGRGIARQREHERGKPWWPYVARQEIEHYPTRREAADRERSLIEALCPPFNTVHARASTRDLYLALNYARPVEQTRIQEPEGRRIPMRIVLAEDDYLIATTDLIDADLTARIEVPAGREVLVEAAKRKPKVTFRKVGAAITMRVHVRGARDFESVTLMYKHAQPSWLVKRIEMQLTPGATAAL